MNTAAADVFRKLQKAASRKGKPSGDWYIPALDSAIQTLKNESESYRPRDDRPYPGGLLDLQRDMPTIIVPDLHARTGFILKLCSWTPAQDKTVLELLLDTELQIVCVGDGVHSEARAADRWQKTVLEYAKKFKQHKHMDEEIRESFGLMEMVMHLKSACPSHFHFLKGNHENIANEDKEGNHPFRKFAFEGQMFKDYTQMFLGDDFFQKYYEFEKLLPIFVIGKNFLISHCEPRTFYPRDMLINYYDDPKVIEDLTWTDNDAAEEGSVQTMLRHYLPDQEGPVYYFGGHRPVNGTYNARANGKYIQLHNPSRYIISYVRPGEVFNPEKDVIDITEN
ncbi:MAG: hypothetical protein ACLFR1_15790 [Spirochaetia bacterium]